MNEAERPVAPEQPASPEHAPEPERAVEPEGSILAKQAEEQRAAMLRELAEQRERMQARNAASDGSIGEPVEAELARLPEHAGEPDSEESSPTGAIVKGHDPSEESPAVQRSLGRIP